MGVLLFIVATILWIPLTFINWIVVAFKYGLSNDYFLETATDIDRFGNRNFRAFLNWSMQKNGYNFGNVNETISSALGKNERDKTLTKFGKIMCTILNFLDKNHCQKSINTNI
jgi:hypothetical protein